LPHAGDWFQWCRHAFHGEVAYLAEPMVCYRVHDTNMSHWYHENPHKLIRDEVEVRWRVRSMAAQLGRASIVKAATDAIAWDYGQRVALKLTENWPLGMTMDAFRESLRSHTDDPAVTAQATVTAFRAVADAYYQKGDTARARQFYNQALDCAPFNITTRAKLALLASGSVGRAVRTAASRWLSAQAA